MTRAAPLWGPPVVFRASLYTAREIGDTRTVRGTHSEAITPDVYHSGDNGETASGGKESRHGAEHVPWARARVDRAE
jgi:hypothetical protein